MFMRRRVNESSENVAVSNVIIQMAAKTYKHPDFDGDCNSDGLSLSSYIPFILFLLKLKY